MLQEETRTRAILAMTSIALFSIALLSIAGCLWTGVPRTIGSGVLLAETRETGAFDRVEVSGALEAMIQVGGSSSVQVEGDDNIVPLLETEVRNRTLVVRMRPNTSVQYDLPLKIVVVTPDLESIGASGAVEVSARGISSGNFSLEASGACEIELSGSVECLGLDISGATSVVASSLRTTAVEVDVSGASTVSLAEPSTIEGELSGACTLVHGGDPAGVRVNTSGVCEIHRRPTE